MANVEKKDEKRCKGRGRKFFWGAIIITAILILFSISNGCDSQHRDRHPSYRGSGYQFHEGFTGTMFLPSGWAFKELDLTNEQLAEIKAILNEFTPKMNEFRSKHVDLKKQFITALEADQVSLDELSKIRNAYVNLFDQASGQMVDAVLKVTEILTPEQRQDLMKTASIHRKRR